MRHNRRISQLTGVVGASLVAVTVAAEASPALPAALAFGASNLKAVAVRLESGQIDTVHFGFDLDSVDTDAEQILRKQAAFILRHPGARFAVTGHTDRVGNVTYNKDLGMRRARNVVEKLVRLGVRRDQLQAMVSFGEDEPIVQTENRERLNRRVTTTVIRPETSLPRTTSTTRERKTQMAAAKAANPETTTSRISQSTPEATPSSDPEPTSKPKKERVNSGRGNGDEENGDPGKSEGKNRGGDEVGKAN